MIPLRISLDWHQILRHSTFPVLCSGTFLQMEKMLWELCRLLPLGLRLYGAADGCLGA